MSDKTNPREPAPTKGELHAKYDVPSEAPGFEGATPQALARALFTPVRRRKEENCCGKLDNEF
ncbi:hypothetical protein [Candidatus Palauibacter sp.]|uniref:hypothetical protein n=1 Tax=Candidatus Palauibacter sp. TaxID=3101350 RepID=UPI003AF22369